MPSGKTRTCGSERQMAHHGAIMRPRKMDSLCWPSLNEKASPFGVPKFAERTLRPQLLSF